MMTSLIAHKIIMADPVNEAFEKVLNELQNEPDNDNPGHLALLDDMGDLAKEVIDHEFHDFKNKKYALPKVALIEKLQKLIENAKEGKYDN